MSNNKHAYGWFGHIITPEGEVSDDDKGPMNKAHIWPVRDITFLAIQRMYDNAKLPPDIMCEKLGIIDGETYFLAIGHPKTFCEGYTYYGTAFPYLDLKHGGFPDYPRNFDQLYRKSLKRHFDLTLPVSRFMVGVSSEH